MLHPLPDQMGVQVNPKNTTMPRRLVIGDIHGCYHTLSKLLEEKIKIVREDQVYFLGDYIDRGPFSREVLEYMLKLRAQEYSVFFIRGNHEDMFLKAMDDEQYLAGWFRNGAEETLLSFNIPESFRYSQILLKSIPAEIYRFISGMPYYYELDDHILVHAGLNFDADEIFKDTDSMLWIRNFHYDGERVKHKKIIHGHTPMPLNVIIRNSKKPMINSLNIDGGCVYIDMPGYGQLVAMDMDTRELFVQENVDM